VSSARSEGPAFARQANSCRWNSWLERRRAARCEEAGRRARDNIIHLALKLLQRSVSRSRHRRLGGGCSKKKKSVMTTSKMINGAGWMFGAGALALLLAAASQLVAG
jgi:hypothetical protein